MRRNTTGGYRREVRDTDNLPGLGSRRLDLEVHISIPKVNPGFVVVRWDAVLVGNGAEMVKLIIEDVGDILDDLLLTVPEKSCVAENNSRGSTGIKLSIESIPFRLVRWEHADNILNFRHMVLHLTLEKLNNEELHGKLGVTGVVDTANLVNIMF